MQDMTYAGHDICRTCKMQDRMDAGQVGCRSNAEQFECRTVRMQDRSDAVQVGCRTGKSRTCQIKERTYAVKVRCSTGQIQCMTDAVQDICSA